jgi:hypothetical protein
LAIRRDTQAFSHFYGHFLAIFRLFVAQSSGNVLQPYRDLVRFAEHLKGTFYDDMSAITYDDGFEIVDISREPAILAEFFECCFAGVGKVGGNEIQQPQSTCLRRIQPAPLSSLFQRFPTGIIQEI